MMIRVPYCVKHQVSIQSPAVLLDAMGKIVYENAAWVYFSCRLVEFDGVGSLRLIVEEIGLVNGWMLRRLWMKCSTDDT